MICLAFQFFISKVFERGVLFDLFRLLTHRGWFSFFIHVSIYPFTHISTYSSIYVPTKSFLNTYHIIYARENSAGWVWRDGGFISSSAILSVSTERRNDTELSFLWCFIIYPSRKFDHRSGAVVEGHFTLFEIHEKCTDGSVVHLSILIYVNIHTSSTSSRYSGESHGSGVYEWQYAHLIIFGLSDGFPNVTFSFCQTIDNGGQGMSEKSNPDFSSLPFLCSVFMAPVTGILL